MKKIILFLIISASSASWLKAQTYLDLSTGTSNRDQVLFNASIKKQFNEKFRAGIEIQTGLVDYRFIGAKLIEEGNSTSISVPLLWKLFDDDRIRLNFYSRAGVRIQSVSSNYATEQLLEDNSSFGYFIEPGLMVSLPLTEKFNLQSGFTLPVIIESSPVGLFENNVTNLFATTAYQLSNKSILLFKANTGPAAGADGDSQKYTWSFQLGLRFLLKGESNRSALVIEPSY